MAKATAPFKQFVSRAAEPSARSETVADPTYLPRVADFEALGSHRVARLASERSCNSPVPLHH